MSKLYSKEYLKFLPLLILYLIITLVLNENTLKGDEGRYLNFAQNLINGYYANPDMKSGFLWNGPGYPIILIPFKYFNLSLIFPKLLNAIFLFIAIVYLYKSLLFFINRKKSFIVSILCGLTHPYFIFSITSVLTESLSFFLISLSLYYFLIFFKTNKKSALLSTSFLLGYLMLTKVFFSYVLLLGLIILIGISIRSIIKKTKLSQLRFVKLILYAFLVCSPYLIYTYSLTGKFFYWGDAGGSSLYCMSTPFEGEYGDWFPPKLYDKLETPTFSTLTRKNTLYKNHSKFLDSISNFDGLKQDELLKERGLLNIKNHKIKYLKNIIYNFGRISFRYPFTNRETQPLLLIVNILHFCSIFFPLICTFTFLIFKKLEDELISLAAFLIISVAGILLLSAESRFVFPLYPVIFFLIGSILVKRVKFSNE
jgi:4-amino-4-deoxy-L-arabinose transferase-like glycosyltransferase